MPRGLESIVNILAQMRTDQYPEGIIVSQDFGVHRYCDINSNCPEAIKLRRYIAEAGLELDVVLQEHKNILFNSLTSTSREINYPDFSGKTTIMIAGKEIEVDLSEIIEEELKRAFFRKIDWFRDAERQLRDLGSQLHTTLLNDIIRNRRSNVLPQLSFPIDRLIKTGCLVTTDSERYLIIFPFKYRPRWLWTQGVRYRMGEEDTVSLERNVFLAFSISKEGKFLTPRLIDYAGNKFYHYHASRNSERDCWGQVHIPERWDREFKSLVDLKYQLEGVIATINLDSLYSNTPPLMPYAWDLMERATKEGEEGKIKRRKEGEEVEEVSAWSEYFSSLATVEEFSEVSEEAPIPRRWGER